MSEQHRRGFAARVEAARADAGLTMTELSTRSGVSARVLRDRMSGFGARFTVDELDALADATGSSLEFLLFGPDSPVPSRLSPEPPRGHADSAQQEAKAPLERIAAALERIADAQEARSRSSS